MKENVAIEKSKAFAIRIVKLYKYLTETKNEHIDFYSNGHFEFVSGLGIIIGTYEEVAQYHRVVLNAYLVYKDEEYSYKLPDGISGSMIVSGENPAYLWRIGEVSRLSLTLMQSFLSTLRNLNLLLKHPKSRMIRTDASHPVTLTTTKSRKRFGKASLQAIGCLKNTATSESITTQLRRLV